MTDSAPPFQDPAADAKRERAKMRLYVMCQTLGWGAFLGMQLFFSRIIRASNGGDPQTIIDDLNVVTTLLIGLLVSHYTRIYIDRWGLKEMVWRRLVPRAAGIAFVMSSVWSIVGYGWIHGILGYPYPSNVNPFVLISLSVINGSIVYGAWLAVYFIYHVYNRFNQSEIERLRLTAVVKDAELRALKSQVNPHFMFNSLNSVRALIDEDPNRAREAVTQLANMLRYSLQAGRKQTVSFEDELTVVNDYLALEQVRHEERLRLRLDVAPETLHRTIPPMLLQTLVENAVKYGISTQPNGGEIAIEARIQDSNLHIAVRNPGNLRPAGTVDPKRPQSTGVGLRNASDRLQLLFGDSATLSLAQTSSTEVTAEVVVPQEGERGSPAPARSARRRRHVTGTPDTANPASSSTSSAV